MANASKVQVDSFVTQCNGQMVPINNAFSYFAAMPVEEADLRQWLYEPVASVPPNVGDVLPKLRIILVPYLEAAPASSPNGKDPKGSSAAAKTHKKSESLKLVSFRRPAGPRRLVSYYTDHEGQTFLFLAVKDQDIADYHYTFFNSLAALISRRMTSKRRERFNKVVRDELLDQSHGEVDESSWSLKEEVLRQHADPKRNSKVVTEYFQQALEDTLTLYFHGLCCDIDIDAGPRQLSSRNLRRRLLLLREILPPPSGFALFPEEL